MNESTSPKPDQQSVTPEKLLILRFEYAWKYFNFHATQRTTMFNFFLVFSGFFVGACAKLLENKQYGFLLMTLNFGVLITLMFIFMERRNEELVHEAEDMLRMLEKDSLFKDMQNQVDWPQRRYWWGGMKKEKFQKVSPSGIFLAEDFKNESIGKSVNRHGRWLPIIEFSLFCMYVLFIFYLLYTPFRSWVMSFVKLLPS